MFVLLFLLFSYCICLKENITTTVLTRTKFETEPDFVPIGKDVSLQKTTNSGKTGEETKEVWKDGLKYTEIIRQTPLGGIQTTHVKGDMAPKPSLLPQPLSGLTNLGKMLTTFQNNMDYRNDRISSNNDFEPHRNMYPEGFDPMVNSDPRSTLSEPRLDGLLGRLGLMTGRILDGVADFLYRQ